VRRIAISGLVAVAAVLGGVAVPAASAMAQPTAAVRPVTAVRAAGTALAGAAAEAGAGASGEPLISCVLSTDCVGVNGSSRLSTGNPSTPTRVARWNGSAWKGVGVAVPKGTKSLDLNGVSCKGAKSCLVVGDYYTSTTSNAANHVLALFYNGTSVKPTATVPLPKGTTSAALSGVSCATTRYCVALGEADGASSAFGAAGTLTIIETWNGAKWTLHTASESIGKTTFVQPTVVSCATAAFCVLAGESSSMSSSSLTTKLYAASWNGKKITTMKPATVGGSASFPLATVASCATASNCAVTGADVSGVTGTGSGATTVKAFTEIWNGKTWQLGKVTWPKGTAESYTLGVSCYGAHSCEAVGEDGASDAQTSPFGAAAVSFTGVTGKLQSVPKPSKGDSNAFAAVSCVPGGRCVATGETGKATAVSPALMTGVWNGKAWKLDPGL
jgi:hypothetical protein